MASDSMNLFDGEAALILVQVFAAESGPLVAAA